MEKKAHDENRKSSMTRRKIQCLESIGFNWAKRKGDAAWRQKYHELREYKQQHGDCESPMFDLTSLELFAGHETHQLSFSQIGQVPTKYTQNPALGRWVSTQVSRSWGFLCAPCHMFFTLTKNLIGCVACFKSQQMK